LIVPAVAQEVAFQMATATFTQSACNSHSPAAVHNGSTADDGWAIAVHCGAAGDAAFAQTLVLETAVDLDATNLQFLLTQGPTGHLIGRFRLSVTGDDRATFADGLASGGDVSANWTVLAAPIVTGPAGLVFTVLPDESVLVSGSASSAVYDVRYSGSYTGVTGIRLEALEHPSLPYNGPGKQGHNSNLQLRELDLFATGTPVAEAPRDVVLLDFDGDGDLDAATANEGSEDLRLYTNDGGGVLVSASAVSLQASDGAPVALARADLDADGAHDDLAVACQSSSTLSLVTNPGTSSPSVLSLALPGLRPSCVAAGNLDADPRTDLVVGFEGLPLAGGGGLALVSNGAPAVALTLPSGHPTQVAAVALGDLDGDGDRDLAALVRGGADEVLLFDGDAAGALSFVDALALSSAGLASSLALDDLDRDGRNDLAVVQPALFPPSQSLRVFRRTSSGPLSAALFASNVLATSGTLAVDLASGDLEDDALPGFFSRTELVQVNAGDGSVTMHHGYDGASFQGSSSVTAGVNPIAAAIGDLNRDGCDDLVIANQGSSDLRIVISTPPALAQSYGASCGGPQLGTSSAPTLGNTAFAVALSNARSFAPALFLFSDTPAQIALAPSACSLYLAAPISTILRFTDGRGAASLPIAVPNFPALRGIDLYFQAAIFRSPGGAFESTLDISSGLRLQVGS
jgi:hypothetical protein